MSAANNIHQAPFKNQVTLVPYKKQLEKVVKRIDKHKEQYLVVCTGHQGEPGSILDRIARGALPLRLSQDDQIIFSSKTIPTPVNVANREQLEKRLKKYKVRIFDNVHVSGHGGREDLRDLIKLTNPEHIFPSHGDPQKLAAGLALAQEMGYIKDKNIHVLADGKGITL